MLKRRTTVKQVMVITAILAGVLAAAHADDARIMEVYPVFTPDAAVLVSTVQAVLGEDAKVIYDRAGGRIMVLATTEEQVRAVEVLSKLNLPPPNIRIDVTINESDRHQLTEFSLDASGGVAVTPESAQAGVRAEGRANRRRDQHRRALRQTLLVQSGGEALLRVGEEVPYVEWLVDYGFRQGYISQHVTMREVGASLRIQARVIGNGPLISLTVTPELAGLSDAGDQRIVYTHLSTHMTIEDGQTVELGGLNENTDFFEHFLVGVDRESSHRALTISATSHIEAFAAGGEQH
jgi:type II secretory pathway component HofQ